jgi:hypothetical protein
MLTTDCYVSIHPDRNQESQWSTNSSKPLSERAKYLKTLENAFAWIGAMRIQERDGVGWQ